MLAAVLSALLLLVMVVFYYRWLASLFPTSGRVTDQMHKWIRRVGAATIRDSWMRIGSRPNPYCQQTFLPIEIVAASYVLRAGIFRFTDNDRLRKIHDLATAYSVSLTCVLSITAAIGAVYGVSPLRRDLFMGAIVAILIVPSLRLVASLFIRILENIWGFLWVILRTAWKYLVLVVVAISQFLSSMDEFVKRWLSTYIEQPLARLFSRVDRILATTEGVVDQHLDRREQIQKRKDSPEDV